MLQSTGGSPLDKNIHKSFVILTCQAMSWPSVVNVRLFALFIVFCQEPVILDQHTSFDIAIYVLAQNIT